MRYGICYRIVNSLYVDNFGTKLLEKELPAVEANGGQSKCVFGKVFVNETPDYDWWVVEDEYGKDACVRYKETSLLIFPLTMLSKRIEDGDKFDVYELFHGLRQDLERIKNENYANA